MTQLQQISTAGLEKFQRSVDSTKKTLPIRVQNESGKWEDSDETEPNPAYETAVRQLEAAQYHYDTVQRIVAKAASQEFKRNQYAGKCKATGVEVKPFAGFTRKEDGKWVTYSFFSVVEILGITIEGLPEIK